jgi:DNA-binding XRE family transcriptional regulator
VAVTEIPAAVAAELARLQAENARLLRMLELSPRQAAPPGPAQAGFFDAPPGSVHKDIAAGMEQLRAEQRAFRLAEMRRRLGITQAEVAARMGITQGRVSAIEHAKPSTTELCTLAAYVEALGGRLEIIADFGDQRLAFAEPGTEAA